MSTPHIPPASAASIQDPELQALIERCAALGVPDTGFTHLIARVPDYAKTLLKAMLLSHTEGNIDHRLKEIIRVQLARTAGDTYFATLRSRRAREQGLNETTIDAGRSASSATQFSAAEQWALRYAREMYTNPENVDAAFYTEGKRHYSEAQIMELGAFIAFHYGTQAWTRTLNLGKPRST